MPLTSLMMRLATRPRKAASKGYRLAAEQGSLIAQSTLGTLYHLGEGVQQNYAEAMKWYRMAAEQGDASAQFAIGRMYRAGEGVPRDYSEAATWLRMSAEQGVRLWPILSWRAL